MNLSETGSLASVGSFLLAAILAITQNWDKIIEKGSSIFTKLPLILVILGIMSAAFAIYSSWYIYPNQSEFYIGKEVKLSNREERILKKLIQEYKEPIKQSPIIVYKLPPLGEKAVPNIFLENRPKLQFTDKEFRTLFRISPRIVEKILDNQVEWRGYADIADAAVKGYRDYIRNIFSGMKPK